MIRPATEADLPRIAALISQNRTDPLTLETLRDFETNFPAGGSKRVLVYEDGSGAVQGCGRAMRWPHDPADRRKIDLSVAREARKQGIGKALLEALLAEEIREVWVDVRDDDLASRRFAERHGFCLEKHIFESSLDLSEADEEALRGWVASSEARGVRFFSLAETPAGEEELRRLWYVNTTTARDKPDGDKGPTFEEWCDLVPNSSWFDHEGQILAASGDDWVGLGAIGTFVPGRFYNLYTGVLAAYRGRGIATALKAKGILLALARGGETIRTNNHADNAAMLAVNRKLGYRPLPGWYAMKKEISLCSPVV